MEQCLPRCKPQPLQPAHVRPHGKGEKKKKKSRSTGTSQLLHGNPRKSRRDKNTNASSEEARGMMSVCLGWGRLY